MEFFVRSILKGKHNWKKTSDVRRGAAIGNEICLQLRGQLNAAKNANWLGNWRCCRRTRRKSANRRESLQSIWARCGETQKMRERASHTYTVTSISNSPDNWLVVRARRPAATICERRRRVCGGDKKPAGPGARE